MSIKETDFAIKVLPTNKTKRSRPRWLYLSIQHSREKWHQLIPKLYKQTYLRINLTKHCNTCTLKTKNIAEKNQGLISGALPGRLNIVKMPIVPNRPIDWTYFPLELWLDFWGRNKLILKCIWKHKGSKITKIILWKKHRVKGLTLPIWRLITKLHEARQCCTNVSIDIKIK